MLAFAFCSTVILSTVCDVEVIHFAEPTGLVVLLLAEAGYCAAMTAHWIGSEPAALRKEVMFASCVTLVVRSKGSTPGGSGGGTVAGKLELGEPAGSSIQSGKAVLTAMPVSRA